jgi:hypothetical protein
MASLSAPAGGEGKHSQLAAKVSDCGSRKIMPSQRSTESFVSSGRSLEDAFFMEGDRLLVERRAQLHKMEETKEALAAVSGIKDASILDCLVRLQVSPESLAALAVVPMIQVTWADGKLDDKEREVVLAHASKRGIQPGSIEFDLLDRWLAHAPEPGLLEAWHHYVAALCERLDPSERDRLKTELLRDVHAAAQASGGFLGLGAVSREERAVIEKLESSFCKG